MKDLKRLLLALLACLALSGWAQADPGRKSLGLSGCPLAALAVSADADVTVAACDSPLGLYVSRDFGTSWSFAEGGS